MTSVHFKSRHKGWADSCKHSSNIEGDTEFPVAVTPPAVMKENIAVERMTGRHMMLEFTAEAFFIAWSQMGL
jgi:hypothetical protein